MLRKMKRWVDRALVPKRVLLNTIERMRTELMMSELDAIPNMTGSYTDGTRQDGFYSRKTGHGTENDKAEMVSAYSERRLSRPELDAHYRNGLIQRIINLPIADATRGWITIQHPDPKVSKLLLDQLDALGIFHKTFQAACYGRMYRQAGVYIDIDDGQELDQPVDLASIKAIPVASVHDSQFLIPQATEWFSTGSEILEPITYRLGMKSIHRDRIMIFNGLDAGINNRISCMGTGESVMDAIYRPFRNLDVDYNAASTLAKDFRIMMIKLAGFGNKVSQNGASDNTSALARLRVMKGMLSIVHAWVGGDQDSVEWKTAPVQGYPELVQLTKEFLCWVTGIPHTKLFNEGTGAGLNNGKGESEQNDWAAVIEDIREHVLRPQLNKIIRYLCALNGIDELVTFEFPPMNPMTPKEKAEVRRLNAAAELDQARADSIRLRDGLIYREEIRRSRWIECTGDNADVIQVRGEKPPEQADIPVKPTPVGLTPFGNNSNRMQAPGQMNAAKDPTNPDDMGNVQDGLALAEMPPGTLAYVPIF